MEENSFQETKENIKKHKSASRCKKAMVKIIMIK